MASATAIPLEHPTDAGKTHSRRMPHALVMMLLIITAAVALTYVIPSGEFQRKPGGLVVAGTYHTVPKDYAGVLSLKPAKTEGVARPASPIAIVSSIPTGMARSATLIFMILFIGGMFGVLQQTGALEAGIERLLVLTRGNVTVVVPIVMILLAAGSTFLGLISEYLVIIPMALVLSERLGYDALFGTALVTVAAKIGYLTSVTNPLALAVAQPIVGVPVFSGAGFRAVTFLVFLPIGIWYVLRSRRPIDVGGRLVSSDDDALGSAEGSGEAAARLTVRQVCVLLSLMAAIVIMVVGVQRLNWSNPELAAMYLGVALVIAVVGGVDSRDASQAFVRGMQGMMLAALLVGLAAAVEVILREGMILDSIVAFLTRSLNGKPPVIVANLMMILQMAIDVFIPSTSGKAAVTMPILAPIGQLAGVSGQVTVQAFLFGNGLMNTLTPTSGMLLAYLATGKISYGRWIRFILPLAAGLFALCAVALTIGVLTGL
ncbi:MAG: Na+/H+ antiporter NhaC family protein [bacterium]